MFSFLETTTDTTTTSGGGLNTIYTILMLVVMLAVFYFLLIRPQRKKEKAAQEMRNNVNVGDGVTTIGGIIGIVISIKDDTLSIETGSDRNRIRVKKWAVQDVEKINIEE